MTGWPAQPVILEVNTATWLDGLSRATGRPVTLGDVPDDAWDALTRPGVDAVWPMGVWERSPAGLALVDADLRASFREALPDLRSGDVIGSPYCVRRYVVDAASSTTSTPTRRSGRRSGAGSWPVVVIRTSRRGRTCSNWTRSPRPRAPRRCAR
ncbi:hypothetical protein AB0I60_27410 [Actinosynnema sp. NPDC050436]|uniref:hypothetical protein n=1 Tax=Actinosynnema sp. NPDC050436 TaxID=3155659 RepID=UPI0033D4E7DF